MAKEDKEIYIRLFQNDLYKRIGKHKLKEVVIKEEPGPVLSIWLIGDECSHHFTQVDLDDLLSHDTYKALDKIAYICAIAWADYVKLIRGEK